MRDDKGRFVKGQTGNPQGRPPKATEQEYRDALLDVVPIERFKRMIEAQAKRAERGDIQAFTAIANRLLPVITKNEHTGADGAPIQIVNVGMDIDKL